MSTGEETLAKILNLDAIANALAGFESRTEIEKGYV
jgi:hypothetical protein